MTNDKNSLVEQWKKIKYPDLKKMDDDALRKIISDNAAKIMAVPSNAPTSQLSNMYQMLGENDAAGEILAERRESRDKFTASMKEWKEERDGIPYHNFAKLKAASSVSGQLVAAILEEEGDLSAEELAGWCEELAALEEATFNELLAELVRERVLIIKDGKYRLMHVCTQDLYPENQVEWGIRLLKQAEEKGDADLATEYYEQLDNEIVNDSKYEYITLHKDSSDAITERYINELWAEGYEKEKIAALINEIYPITINMVLNRSDDDETTNLESATIEDKYDAICFHMTLEGGLAEHKYSLKLVGSTDIEDEIFNESYDGTMPAGIKDFFHVKKNSQHIWGFTKTKYIKIELVDKDTDEVLKTVEMKLDYK